MKKIVIDMNKVKQTPCYVCGQGKGHNKSLHVNDVKYVLSPKKEEVGGE